MIIIFFITKQALLPEYASYIHLNFYYYVDHFTVNYNGIVILSYPLLQYLILII